MTDNLTTSQRIARLTDAELLAALKIGARLSIRRRQILEAEKRGLWPLKSSV